MCIAASDPAQNPYWKRDVRRAYPKLSVVTQPELSTLLLQHAASATYVHTHLCLRCLFNDPSYSHSIAGPEGENASVPATSQEPLELTAAIAKVNAGKQIFSESNLPPKLPTAFKRWIPERAPEVPHDPNAYFPMVLFK